MAPRVSVLVPSYNHARFLRAALESVLAQTFQDWEVILVDDGSSDNSVEVARSVRDPRIRVCSNETNLGTYGTEQKALDMAQGEFIAVLNSDDVWEPPKLAAQTAALDASPESAFCYVLGWKIDAEGRQDDSDDVHADWPTTPHQELLPHLLYENRVLASSVLSRRDGLRFETSCRYSGDWVALLEAARRGPCVCVPERLSHWRIHGANSFTASQKQLIEEIRVREAIARDDRWVVRALPESAIRAGLAKNAMNLLALYAVFLDGAAARRAGMAALKLAPSDRAVAKRAVASFLPIRSLRQRLWADKLDWSKIDAPAGRAALRIQTKLELR